MDESYKVDHFQKFADFFIHQKVTKIYQKSSKVEK